MNPIERLAEHGPYALVAFTCWMLVGGVGLLLVLVSSFFGLTLGLLVGLSLVAISALFCVFIAWHCWTTEPPDRGETKDEDHRWLI